MTKNQPNSAGDVENDQTPHGEDVAKGISVNGMGDQASFDLVAELAGGEPAPESESVDKTKTTSQNETEHNAPESTEDDKSKENKEAEKSEAEATEEETPDEEAEETIEKEDGEKPESFAVLGNLEFETKEELLEYLESQNGYNRWLTGNIKKAHPDWFKQDGTLDPSKIEQFKAATDVPDEKKPISTDEKQRLRDMGFVFKEDLEEARLSGAMETTAKEIESFESKNPELKNHYDEVSELMESTQNLPKERRLNLEQSWNIVASRHGIKTADRTQTQEQKISDSKKKSGLDSQIIPSTSRRSGVAPKGHTTAPDLLDQALASTGI